MADWISTNQRPSTTGLRSISIEIRPIFITTTACSFSNSENLRRQRRRFAPPSRSIRITPKRTPILDLLYEQQGRLDDAFQQFEEAVENRPNYRVAHFHMGRIRANQGKYDEAIQHFLKTLTPEDENTPRYLYALAATYARAGDIAEALKYARTARAQAAARGQAELLASIDKDLQVLEKR